MFELTFSSAGVTDSALTVHGSLQARKLGSYLAQRHRITHLYSSDLQRAYKTARALQRAQQEATGGEAGTLEVRQLRILQERDFGSLEKRSFTSKSKEARKLAEKTEDDIRLEPDFKDAESKASMAARMDVFLNDRLLPLLAQDSQLSRKSVVAVVSHGMILSAFWKRLLKRVALNSVSLGPGISDRGGTGITLDSVGVFSNTGYLEVDITKQIAPAKAAGITAAITSQDDEDLQALGNSKVSTVLYGWVLIIKAINSKEHLRGLKRTGGGVGSSKHDDSQRSIDGFVKRRRVTRPGA